MHSMGVIVIVHTHLCIKMHVSIHACVCVMTCLHVSISLLDLIHAKSVLDAARPTAVNLSWATARMVELATKMEDAGIEINIFRERLLHEAQELATVSDMRMDMWISWMRRDNRACHAMFRLQSF